MQQEVLELLQCYAKKRSQVFVPKLNKSHGEWIKDITSKMTDRTDFTTLIYDPIFQVFSFVNKSEIDSTYINQVYDCKSITFSSSIWQAELLQGLPHAEFLNVSNNDCLTFSEFIHKIIMVVAISDYGAYTSSSSCQKISEFTDFIQKNTPSLCNKYLIIYRQHHNPTYSFEPINTSFTTLDWNPVQSDYKKVFYNNPQIRNLDDLNSIPEMILLQSRSFLSAYSNQNRQEYRVESQKLYERYPILLGSQVSTFKKPRLIVPVNSNHAQTPNSPHDSDNDSFKNGHIHSNSDDSDDDKYLLLNRTNSLAPRSVVDDESSRNLQKYFDPQSPLTRSGPVIKSPQDHTSDNDSFQTPQGQASSDDDEPLTGRNVVDDEMFRSIQKKFNPLAPSADIQTSINLWKKTIITASENYLGEDTSKLQEEITLYAAYLNVMNTRSAFMSDEDFQATQRVIQETEIKEHLEQFQILLNIGVFYENNNSKINEFIQFILKDTMVVDDIFLQVKKIHHEAEYFMTKTDRNSYINLLRKILNRSKDINQLEAISKIQNEFQQIKINHKPEAITDELTRLSAMISNPDIFPVSENFKSFTTTIELGSFLKSKISKTFDEINKYATELILERKNILEEIIQQMKQCLKSLNDEFTLLSGLHESKEQKKALDFVKQFNILEQNFKLQGKNTPVFKSHFPQNNEIYEQFQKFDHEIRIMVEEISDVEQKLTNYNTNVTRIAESIEKCISADLFDALIKVIDGGEYKSDLYSIFSRGRSRFLQHVLENLEALSVESASCKDIEHSKALFAKAEELNEKTKELYTMKFQWAVSENDVEETGILDRIKSNIKIIESNNNSIVEDEKPKAANKFQAMKEKVRKRG